MRSMPIQRSILLTGGEGGQMWDPSNEFLGAWGPTKPDPIPEEWGEDYSWYVHALTASDRRECSLKYFKDFSLKAKTIIWP